MDGMDEGAEATAAEPAVGSVEHLTDLADHFEAQLRECRAAVATRYMRYWPDIVPHADREWLNIELTGIQALNRKQRPYHRIRGPETWPSPPIPTNVLISAGDLIPYFSDALLVLSAAREDAQFARLRASWDEPANA